MLADSYLNGGTAPEYPGIVDVGTEIALPTDKLDEIIAVLPGVKSPTIMPLATEGWSSVHTVLDQKCFWDIIGKLKALGAQGILVIPIEKMIL